MRDQGLEKTLLAEREAAEAEYKQAEENKRKASDRLTKAMKAQSDYWLYTARS